MTRQTNNAMRACGLLIAAAAVAILSSTARAEIIGGVDFPAGALSFADAVVSYTPAVDTPDPVTLVGQSPDARWRNADDALGAPNYTSPPSGAATHNLGQFVSLGNGGTLVVKFVDNALTGSGTASADLYVFEVGPVVEASFVWISTNNVDWLYAGRIAGSTRGIDIDPVLAAASLATTTMFQYVAIQDDRFDYPAAGMYGFYAGADIDAIGAISSVPVVPVPEPATLALLTLGGALVLFNRRNRKIRSSK
ncbi:MAG: PEP-CTERM sorting domain-containing protein [Planctomycetaceae bacterium]|nr:PEP-CTERM sorting domain-containing protein [Planctomycetaceae bacterium]